MLSDPLPDGILDGIDVSSTAAQAFKGVAHLFTTHQLEAIGMTPHTIRMSAMDTYIQDTYTQAYTLRTMQELQRCLPTGEPPKAPSVIGPLVRHHKLPSPCN